MSRQKFNEELTCKECTTCKVMLPVDKFGIVTGLGTLRGSCRGCLRVNQNEIRRTKGPELNQRRRERRINDLEWKESQNAHRRDKYSENPQPYIEATKEYYNKIKEDPERRDGFRKYRRAFHKDRQANDPQYKIRRNLRTRIHTAIKFFAITGIKKKNSTLKYIGCSLEFVMGHLEAQFQEGMTWQNYGSEWEIDHIRPFASYDLQDENQWFVACHYSNLQPLWIHENRSKGAKYG